MNPTVNDILNLIEEARAAGGIGNDQARAASVALQLEGDDAMLACRLIAQGPDPASLDYMDLGEVDPLIAAAHRQGPGVYNVRDPLHAKKRMDYLALCALSADEATDGDQTVRDRLLGFIHAYQRLNHPDETFRDAALEALAQREADSIADLPYTVRSIGGDQKMGITGSPVRVYTSDLGFAAAAWDGQPMAAVLATRDGKDYVALGAPPYAPPLDDQVLLSAQVKKLSPRFWIIEDQDMVRGLAAED